MLNLLRRRQRRGGRGLLVSAADLRGLASPAPVWVDLRTDKAFLSKEWLLPRWTRV